MTPEDFSRAFALAFAEGDSGALSRLLAPEGTALTLTGVWAEGRAAAEAAFAAEAQGALARARLVTGRGSILPLGPGISLLRQRFVVTGARDASGADVPRFGAMLTAVLRRSDIGQEAESLAFSAVD